MKSMRSVSVVCLLSTRRRRMKQIERENCKIRIDALSFLHPPARILSSYPHTYHHHLSYIQVHQQPSKAKGTISCLFSIVIKIPRTSTSSSTTVEIMSTTTRQSLLLLLVVLLATTFLSTQAFVVPTLRTSSPLRQQQRHTHQRTGNLKMMLTLPPEAPQSFLTTSSNLLIAASRFIKDVPSTLTDMSESVTPDGGVAVGSYTLPDGSYTNAGDVAEVCICTDVCLYSASCS